MGALKVNENCNVFQVRELYCFWEKVKQYDLVKYSRKGAADVTEDSRILAV